MTPRRSSREDCIQLLGPVDKVSAKTVFERGLRAVVVLLSILHHPSTCEMRNLGSTIGVSFLTRSLFWRGRRPEFR